MIDLRHSMEVECPRHDVARCVSNVRLVPLWDPHTVYVEPLDDGPPEVGQQYRTAHRDRGKTVVLVYTLDRFEPDRRLVFTAYRPGSTVRVSFEFDDVLPASRHATMAVTTIDGRAGTGVSAAGAGGDSVLGQAPAPLPRSLRSGVGDPSSLRTTVVVHVQIRLSGLAAHFEPLLRHVLGSGIEAALRGLRSYTGSINVAAGPAAKARPWFPYLPWRLLAADPHHGGAEFSQ